MSDEPSYLAQEIMADIAAGRHRVIPDSVVSKLSEWECLMIDRAAQKHGKMYRDEPEHEFVFDSDNQF